MRSKHRILYLVRSGEPIYEIMRAELPEALELVTLETGARADLLSKLRQADFVITIRMDAEMIAAAPNLKLIQLAGVGFDGVDLDAATSAGIPVAQTVEGTITGVAEHTILLILALYKNLLRADESLRRGEWLVWQLRPKSFTLSGKTVGIVGLGRIGREVAARCRAFGAHLCYSDPCRADPGIERELGLERLPLDSLLANADVVTLHLPCNQTTSRLFGEAQFRAMKPSAIFINTSRGGLVDEEALIRALRRGWIAGAGLDVFAEEPVGPDNPLLRLDNVVLTPHIAAGTRDAVAQKFRAACANFLRVIAGKEPLNVINAGVCAGSR